VPATPAVPGQQCAVRLQERAAVEACARAAGLGLEDIEQALAKSEAMEAKASGSTPPQSGDGRRRTNRGALPPHLPRIHYTIVPDTDCPCCRAPMQVIGKETAQRLDVIPAQYRVIVTHRPKLACRACEKISQAPAPEHLIRSGLPSDGRLGAGGQVRLASAALSPGQDAGDPRHRSGSLNAGLLGRLTHH
jgi:zinc-finger binding domain of transposase IS66